MVRRPREEGPRRLAAPPFRRAGSQLRFPCGCCVLCAQYAPGPGLADMSQLVEVEAFIGDDMSDDQVVEVEALPICDVKGISWHRQRKKWHIEVYDVFATGKKGDPKRQDQSFGVHELNKAIEKCAKWKAEARARFKLETAKIAAQYSWTHNLPRAPKEAEAEKRKKYWKENKFLNYKPYRVVLVSAGKRGLKYIPACHAEGCPTKAKPDTTGATQWCDRHQHDYGVSKCSKQIRQNGNKRKRNGDEGGSTDPM